MLFRGGEKDRGRESLGDSERVKGDREREREGEERERGGEREGGREGKPWLSRSVVALAVKP